MAWAVKCAPVKDETAAGQNRSALIVYLTDGDSDLEISRVGFVRRNTKQKDVPFEQALQGALDVAQEAVATLNEYELQMLELRQAQVDYARKCVQEIVGKKPSTVPL